MKFLALLLVASSLLLAQSFWVQATSSGFEFRATIEPNSSCPSVEVDGVMLTTTLRFEAEKNFTMSVCSLGLPSKSRVVKHKNSTIKIPTSLDKVAIIGDTGCRVKIKKNTLDDKNIQDCSDTNKWPAKKIATLIKEEKPDLIIHVGDYNYREMCDNPKICDKYDTKNWHLGRGYDSWHSDFLEPFGAVLKTAPWVFVRGNHENCDRAWLGYKAMISPYKFSRCSSEDSGSSLTKNATEEPYILEIGRDRFVVFDSAGESDRKPKQSDYEKYTKWFQEYKNTLKTSTLLTHKPLYNLNFNSYTAQRQAFEKQAIKTPLIISGHIHLFEWVESSTIQMIVGNSGTKLDKFDDTLQRRYPSSYQYDGFGYVIGAMDEKKSFTLYDQKGEIIKRLSTN